MSNPLVIRSASYAEEAKQPHVIIAFALPFLVLYEIGVATGALQGKFNGADAILRTLWNGVDALFGQWFAAGLFGIAVLALVAYVVNAVVREHKGIRFSTLSLMLAESLGFALLIATLLSLGFGWRLPTFFGFEQNPGVVHQAVASGLTHPWQYIVASVGAGVFEELLFRLLLLSGLFATFSRGGLNGGFLDDSAAFLKAVLLSSLIFTLLHFGTASSLSGLLSIFATSIGLSFIFARRGLGVAIGTHVAYDLLLLFGAVA